MTFYSRREVGVMCFAAGMLTGMVLAFSSCSPDIEPHQDHITTGAHQ